MSGQLSEPIDRKWVLWLPETASRLILARIEPSSSSSSPSPRSSSSFQHQPQHPQSRPTSPSTRSHQHKQQQQQQQDQSHAFTASLTYSPEDEAASSLEGDTVLIDDDDDNDVDDDCQDCEEREQAATVGGGGCSEAELMAIAELFSGDDGGVSLSWYLSRIVRYSGIGYSSVVASIALLDRALSLNPTFKLSHSNVYRMVLASTVVATKFYDDDYYPNSYYANVGGVNPEEMNQLELGFLALVNFDCLIKRDIYDCYAAAVCCTDPPDLPSPPPETNIGEEKNSELRGTESLINIEATNTAIGLVQSH
ncbi:Cyclin [Pelomyxa schiedti]|nr:Cyclin [Pelomyxa schiedti]